MELCKHFHDANVNDDSSLIYDVDWAKDSKNYINLQVFSTLIKEKKNESFEEVPTEPRCGDFL